MGKLAMYLLTPSLSLGFVAAIVTQFVSDKPIPEELLQKILRYRVAGNLEKNKK